MKSLVIQALFLLDKIIRILIEITKSLITVADSDKDPAGNITF